MKREYQLELLDKIKSTGLSVSCLTIAVLLTLTCIVVADFGWLFWLLIILSIMELAILYFKYKALLIYLENVE